MTYEGFLRIGGVEVVNTERARGYTTTTDCPERWVSDESRCDSLQDALGDESYDYSAIEDAPWYDQSLPDLSSRFYGVVGLDISGPTDSTRASQRTEGVNDGGVIGRSRKAMRGLRVRATIMARGRDALDYGSHWLSSVFDGTCSQHGDACSTTDVEFLADCPPPRGVVDDFTPWVVDATNSVANPSMEAAGPLVSVRRNLIQDPRMTNPTNWGVTNVTSSHANGAVTLVVTTSGTGNMLTATQTAWGTSLSGVAASSSWKVENIGSTPFTVEARFWDGTVYTNGGQVTIPPGEMRVVKIENKVIAGAYGQPRLWMVNPAVGATIRVSEPVLEARLIADTFFTGSLAPKVRRNLARNPRAVTSGSNSWLSNDGSVVPVSRVTDFPIPHPLGITTGAMSRSAAGANSSLASLYNIDGLANTGTPQRNGGLWVLVTEAGYRTDVAWGSVDLPANEWVYLKRVTPWAAGAYTGINLNKVTGNASTTARAYLTGAQVEEGSATVGDFFDGALEAPRGFANSWEGVANQSGSFRTDVDFTVAWEGTPDASVSLLQGYTVVGISSAACFSIRSSRWSAEGQYSLRLIPTQAGNTSYAILTGISNTADRGTAIITRYQEQVITGSLWTAAFGRIYWNPVPQIFSAAALNQPGASEVRVFAAPAPGVASTVILPHGGAAGSGDIWYDLATIVSGVNYTGPAFTGDTPSTEIERHAWTGATNGSASTRERREPITRPRTDEEYALLVDPLRRFMHDIAVTSGPLDVEEFEPSRGFYGKTIEFTITSERAWIYGLMKTLSLPPALPVVVQDTPYNLVPYPSAELALISNSTNRCVANTTGWTNSIAAVGGDANPAPYWTAARSTALVAGGCSASYRGLLQGVASGANVAGIARANLTHEIDLTSAATGDVVDLVSWGRFGPMSGESADPHEMTGTAQWYTAANVAVGAAIPMGTFTTNATMTVWQNFKATTSKPATATKVRISVAYQFLWNSGPTMGVPATIPVYMTGADALTGYTTVATNYSTNPSVETNATGWVAGIGTGAITMPMLTSGRVVNELSASGTASFRVVFTATGASASPGEFTASQIVAVNTLPANARVSIGLWAAEVLMTGAPVRELIHLEAAWVDGGSTVLRTDLLGDVPVNGGAASLTGLTIPAGAVAVIVRARARLTSWDATTVLRLYADALTVTVP